MLQGEVIAGLIVQVGGPCLERHPRWRFRPQSGPPKRPREVAAAAIRSSAPQLSPPLSPI